MVLDEYWFDRMLCRASSVYIMILKTLEYNKDPHVLLQEALLKSL